MKRKFAAAGTGLAAGMMAAAMTMNVFGAQITEDKAKSIALDHAGEKEENLFSVKLEADIENDRQIYEVKLVTRDYREYEYEILTEDGTIMSIDYEKKILATPRTSKPAITMEKAKETALEQAGKKAEDVTFVKEEKEYDDGILVYETEFHTADREKYKYEFNGSVGEIISWEYDGWDRLLADKDQTGGASDKADVITGPEGARAAALKMAGLKNSDVRWGKIEREHEDGRLIYEGKFYCGIMEYEFEIDGATGQILDWEVESIYD